MKVELTIETSTGVETGVIVGLSNRMSAYFSEMNFGNDLLEILIGVICVAPEFEWFSKVRKPKYVFYRKYVRDHVEVIQDRVYTYDVKLDFEKFRNQCDEQNERMLAQEIVKSLSNLDILPKKAKEFDVERFKREIKTFLDERNLLAE